MAAWYSVYLLYWYKSTNTDTEEFLFSFFAAHSDAHLPLAGLRVALLSLSLSRNGIPGLGLILKKKMRSHTRLSLLSLAHKRRRVCK